MKSLLVLLGLLAYVLCASFNAVVSPNGGFTAGGSVNVTWVDYSRVAGTLALYLSRTINSDLLVGSLTSVAWYNTGASLLSIPASAASGNYYVCMNPGTFGCSYKTANFYVAGGSTITTYNFPFASQGSYFATTVIPSGLSMNIVSNGNVSVSCSNACSQRSVDGMFYVYNNTAVLQTFGNINYQCSYSNTSYFLSLTGPFSSSTSGYAPVDIFTSSPTTSLSGTVTKGCIRLSNPSLSLSFLYYYNFHLDLNNINCASIPTIGSTSCNSATSFSVDGKAYNDLSAIFGLVSALLGSTAGAAAGVVIVVVIIFIVAIVITIVVCVIVRRKKKTVIPQERHEHHHQNEVIVRPRTSVPTVVVLQATQPYPAQQQNYPAQQQQQNYPVQQQQFPPQQQYPQQQQYPPQQQYGYAQPPVYSQYPQQQYPAQQQQYPQQQYPPQPY
jgi:preprotein translocase subunit SecG